MTGNEPEYIRNPKLTPQLVACLQDWGIETLTDIQTLAIAEGVAVGESAIVCAPTSSGKTLVGELALANALANGVDTLYLVSHKALAEQKYSDFLLRFSTEKWKPAITVGISTGDHEEGATNSRLLISTYEKALGLILAGRLKVSKTAIIADELQILNEDGRGAQVETLCALLRSRNPTQFVGLTATVENPQDLAAWMNCKAVKSVTRDVDLIQSVRFAGEVHTVLFGQNEGETTIDSSGAADLNGVIQGLLKDGLGPILVFTETRREASELASRFSEKCIRTADGLTVTKELDLFTEPTESSDLLKAHSERRVTFHSADLTPDERSVIETGIDNSCFDVCFATSTLAAGVNFPFRTVVFPKLSYEYSGRAGQMFARSDYRNMSGRAGRLGFHADGRVVLLPKNRAEQQHAKSLVSPENDRVESKLVSLSMRRTVLSLVAARAVSSKAELKSFFENTFYWFQILENNPNLLEHIIAKATGAIDWLMENKFIEESHATILVTPLGKSTSLSGLLPETVKRFLELLSQHSAVLLEKFGNHEIALIHWCATCPEFADEFPSRFLPYPGGGAMKPESSQFMRSVPLVTAWDRTDEKLTRCVHALGLFIQGEAERKIRFISGVSAGNLHRLAADIGWILEGLCCVSGASDVQCPQVLTNNISMLARRVEWGTPVEALDVLRIATRQRVPGFGRQRVMALLANKMSTVMDILGAGKDRLAKLLQGEQRAERLLAALSDTFDGSQVNFERTHVQLAQELGIEEKVIRCNDDLNTDYENAIYALLKEEQTWSVEQLDNGKRQNVPDLLLVLADYQLLIECKTVTKKPPLVSKDEAFAVMQKASDYDPKMKRITLGKPDFDEHSKEKATASPGVTLVRHAVFMEGLMRVLTGRLSAEEFVKWLGESGVTDLGRLPGTPTYAERAAIGA